MASGAPPREPPQLSPMAALLVVPPRQPLMIPRSSCPASSQEELGDESPQTQSAMKWLAKCQQALRNKADGGSIDTAMSTPSKTSSSTPLNL